MDDGSNTSGRAAATAHNQSDPRNTSGGSQHKATLATPSASVSAPAAAAAPTPTAGGRPSGSGGGGGSRSRAVGGGSSGTGSVKPSGRRVRPRLDEVVQELAPEYSRNVVQSFIAQGKVLVDGRPVTKAGTRVKEGSSVHLTAEVPRYVCRAGLKLEAALDAFGVDPQGQVCLDAGLSTGGFTDCLVQRGAALVFGIDVGYGQVAERVRVDPRVVIMERTNLRHVTPEDLAAAAAAHARKHGGSSSGGGGAQALRQQQVGSSSRVGGAEGDAAAAPSSSTPETGGSSSSSESSSVGLVPDAAAARDDGAAHGDSGVGGGAAAAAHVTEMTSSPPLPLVSLVTLDLSFISVLKVLPAVTSCMDPSGTSQALVLIKPQFEAGKAQVSAGGVVRDPEVHKQVIERVQEGAALHGLRCTGVIESPIKGATGGNTEFLARFVLEGGPSAAATGSAGGSSSDGGGSGAAAAATGSAGGSSSGDGDDGV